MITGQHDLLSGLKFTIGTSKYQIKNRAKTTAKKPREYLMDISRSGAHLYLSSLYRISGNCFMFDLNGLIYKLVLSLEKKSISIERQGSQA